MDFVRAFRSLLLPVLLVGALVSTAPSQVPATVPQVTPEVQELLHKASELEKTFQWDQVAQAYLQAAKRAEELGDTVGLGSAYKSAGIACYRMGTLDKAKTYMELARDAYARIGAKDEEMGLRMNIAVILDNSGRPNEARPIYLEVLAYNKSRDLKRQIANALMNLAILESRANNSELGLKYSLEAYEAYGSLKDLRWQSSAMAQAGDAYLALGRLDNTGKAYEEALRLARESKDKSMEATALGSLGTYYRLRGDLVRSLEFSKESYRIKQGVNDYRGQVTSLSTIGIAYEQLGRSEVGIGYMKESVALARRLQNPLLLGSALANLATALNQHKRFSEAKPICEEALKLSQDIGDKKSEAYRLGIYGLILRQGKQYNEAIDTLVKAFGILKEFDLKEEMGTTADYLGGTYLAQKKYDEAITHFRRAINLYAEVNNTRYAATSYANLANAYEKAGRLSEADKAYRTCVGMVEDVRSRLGASPEGKAEFLGALLDNYQDFIALLVQRGRVEEAFELAQKTKARTIVDLLNAGRVPIYDLMTEKERAEERRLRMVADRINADMVREGALNEVGAKARFAQLKSELRKAENALSAFTAGLYAKYPNLAGKRGAGAVSLTQLAKHLPEDTALVEYVTGRRPLAFVVRVKGGKARVHAYFLKVTRASIADQARILNHLAANPRSDYLGASRTLYRTLFAPFEAGIRDTKRLIICPDQSLWDVPFAVLNSRGFLVDRFDLAYAYSATAADMGLRARKPSIAKCSLLVVANPDFGGPARFGDNLLIPGQRPIEPPSRPIEPPSRPIEPPSRPIEPPSRDLDLGIRAGIVQLPGTQVEANALKNLISGTRVLSGAQAQEALLTQQAGEYRVVHIASHAFFNDASPMLSSIVLASPTTKEFDGYLTARELFGLRLRADLVVLSACNTAHGEERSGDGIVGLSWALLAAGAPAQVVSQWSVDDRATAVLMTRFYTNLKKGQRKDEALRKAAASLRDPKVSGNDPRWKHPYYWAPFILLGDSRSLRLGG